ncbi:four-carbon acid sugar kinase family protein [Pragia fontium]|uniref:four-carbon acid sugar kinase family protein n=1 Tax=Pragia fontium TaxID=82985 RepID=UPI000649BA03|nr:four-carbon acid sugar kinase family protein [Pragia fontium]AKJ43235.1 membrane protein [Pragia fontium]
MKVAIVADDLTGANATSALLSKKGFSAITCLEEFHHSLSDFEIVSFSTDSRSIPAKEAYSRVSQCIEQFKPLAPLISKRIDSTLRGNLGAEVDAVLDNNPELMALVVPVYPSSGRICVGGSLLVAGIPLQNTMMKDDPKNPMTESSVLELFRQQSEYEPFHIPLRDVLAGEQVLADRLTEIYRQGGRLVIFDATTDLDIATIAKAAEQSLLPVFCVDPGPFTAQLAHLRYSSNRTMTNKVFIAIGSVSELTQRQIKKLKYDRNVWLEVVAPRQLMDISRHPGKAGPLVKMLLNKSEQFDIVGIDTVEAPEHVCDLNQLAQEYQVDKSEASQMINRGIAEVTAQVLLNRESTFRGIYTSGGDVTVAVTNRLGSKGFILKDEVEPLAVYGHLIGERCNGLSIVTKGGFVGNDSTLVHCIDYLSTKISTYDTNVNRDISVSNVINSGA